jgi:hypothetical protein
MRNEIDLTGPTVTKRELQGEEIVRAGRYLIARTLSLPFNPSECWGGSAAAVRQAHWALAPKDTPRRVYPGVPCGVSDARQG